MTETRTRRHSAASTARVSILLTLAALSVASAQERLPRAPLPPATTLPPPGGPEPVMQLPPQLQKGQPLQQLPPGMQLPQGPQLSGCVGTDGKLLVPVMDLNLVATATGPFSITLTWSGPPATYRVSGPDIGLDVPIGATLVGATVATAPVTTAPTAGRAAAGGYVAQQPSTAEAANVTLARPQYGVVPGIDYGFKVQATLPDGRIVCDTAGTRTPAGPPLTPLASAFVAPDDIRLGFTLPPYVQELNVYRNNYTEDGRQAPFNKRVLQETLTPSPNPLTFTVMTKGSRLGGAAIDGRKRINPGLPPLPTDYNRPIVYDLTVEAIWRDGPRATVTRTAMRVDGPVPLLGWADLHTHPMSHLAFVGKVFHGAPDVGSILPALSTPKQPSILPYDCMVQRDPNTVPPGGERFLRAASMVQALEDDSPTHGDFSQSTCGDAIRRTLIGVLEAANDANMPLPGKRLGAPVFDAWPSWHDVTHQKMWADWIMRAQQGGLRVMVALSHNNRLLGELAKGNCGNPAFPCLLPGDDQSSSDLQITEIQNFVARHSDFMEVALDSANLYRIVRSGKIAVVLGVEIDNLGNFSMNSPPTRAQISGILNTLYSRGVRYIFPVHVSDNVFGGTAPYETLFNAVNYFETNHFWDVECAATQPYPDDEIGYTTPNVTVLDDLNRMLPDPFNRVIPKNVELPKSPQNCAVKGHRNKKGLNLAHFAEPAPPGVDPNMPIGVFAIREMMRRGFIIDVDHMSHRTVEDVLSMAEAVPFGGYPVMSGHSAVRARGTAFDAENSRTPAQLDRIGCLGGMFGVGTSHAEPRPWADMYQAALTAISMRGSRCLYKEIGAGAVALGTDINSLVQTPKPLKESTDLADRNVDPYSKVIVDQRGTFRRFPESPIPLSPTRTWDYRNDGVVHYGMFADFVKAVWSFPLDHNRKMHMSGQDLVEGHLDRNADNFWRMWVKVEQQKVNVR